MMSYTDCVYIFTCDSDLHDLAQKWLDELDGAR
jgi:hypothetical protein